MLCCTDFEVQIPAILEAVKQEKLQRNESMNLFYAY